jgi:acyl-CoA thioesterase-2
MRRARLPLLQRLASTLLLPPTPLNLPYIHTGELLQTAPDTFSAEAHALWTPPGARGVYGGHVLGLSMLAAERTLEPAAAFPLNSLHGYFLRPGNSALPTSFHVERLRDGRSFVTRAVTARQGGKAIFSLQCSFHALEEDASGGAMGHQVAMPTVPSPEELLGAAAARPPGPQQQQQQQQLQLQLPLRVLPCAPRSRAGAWPARQLAWMQVAPLPPPTPATAHLHRAALAFASDWGIGVTSLLPYDMAWNSPQLAIAASLDHAMYFHDPMSGERAHMSDASSSTSTSTSSSARGGGHSIARHPEAPGVPLPGTAPPQRADAYVLFDMESTVLRSGRGMNSCRLWSRDGTLLCTAVQESLLRAR